MKFHVNNEGNAGKCSAQSGNCPFGGEDKHYESVEAAREAFERSQGEISLGGVSKKDLQAFAEDLREAEALDDSPLNTEPGATANAAQLDAMPPASSVLWNGELHRKGVDGHWYYGFGGSSRRASDMDGAVVKENASVPLHPYVQTPELNTLMSEIDQLRESFPPQVHEVRGMYDAVNKLRTTGDSRDYKFGLDLLRLRIEENEDFINEEAMDDRTSVRWLGAVETAQRRLAQGW